MAISINTPVERREEKQVSASAEDRKTNTVGKLCRFAVHVSNTEAVLRHVPRGIVTNTPFQSLTLEAREGGTSGPEDSATRRARGGRVGHTLETYWVQVLIRWLKTMVQASMYQEAESSERSF